MNREYPIFYRGKNVGAATLEHRGLYISIICTVKMKSAGLYRVRLKSDQSEIDLGTCLQNGDDYEIRTSISAKRLPAEQVSFEVISQNERTQNVYPIESGKPFGYMNLLTYAKLCTKNGQLSLLIQEPDQQDSDLIP